MAERGGRPRSDEGLISRREILRRGALGAAGLAALPAVIAACNGIQVTASPAPSPTPTRTPIPPTPSPKPGLAGALRVGVLQYPTDAGSSEVEVGIGAVDSAFTARTGLVPAVDYKREPNYGSYMTNGPDDVCASNAFTPGYRLRLLSSTGLLVPLDDVWHQVGDNFSRGVAEAVTGSDGHIYGIPFDCYPWAFFYRKSVWASKGYVPPTTWTDLLALCGRMKSDGLTPIAFGNRDGWPAFGTFDMLNLRLNGRDFHLGLLSGEQKWTDPRAISVFETWRKLFPLTARVQSNQTWQQSAATLAAKQAGMFYMGLFLATESSGLDAAVIDDLDFFEFPYFGNQWDAEKTVEAPTSIWVMPSKSPTLQADLVNAKAYLGWWAQGSSQLTMSHHKPGRVPTARDTDTSQLDRLSKKAFDLVSGANQLTQFLDRDGRPDWPSLSGAFGGFVQGFLYQPSLDLAAFTRQIQAFWDGMPPFGVDSIG